MPNLHLRYKITQSYRTRVLRLLLQALLITGVIIWLYPFVWMFATSLKTNTEYYDSAVNLIPAIPQWSNYTRAWRTANFSEFFINSVVISSSVTLITLILSCLTGYALGRFNFPGRKIAISLVAAAIFFPIGYTLIPVYLLINRAGLADTLLGVILAQGGGTPTLFILLFAVHFANLPKELEDAAVIDGAGFFRTFLMIFLPLAKPIIAASAILRFMWSWNDFLLPLIFTLSKPSLRTVSVGLFNFVGEHSTDNVGMIAAASIALIPILIIFIFFQRYFIEATAGSVRG